MTSPALVKKADSSVDICLVPTSAVTLLAAYIYGSECCQSYHGCVIGKKLDDGTDSGSYRDVLTDLTEGETASRQVR